MDPVTAALVVGGGAQVAGGIINYMGSEDARKANAKERRALQSALDRIQMPNFDIGLLNPEELKVLQKFSPEIAPFVEEQAPGLIKAATEGATRGREAQMAALDRLRNLSQTGEDTQSKILRDQALAASASQNRGQQEAIRQSLERRGMAGSGMGLVQSLLAQQGSNLGAQQATQQAALEAYQNRLQALRDSASLGSQVRGEDISLEGRNLDTINEYNRRAAERRQGYGERTADVRNRAQAANIEMAQNIASQNVANRNAARQAQRDMANKAQSMMFDAQMAKMGQQSGLSQANMAANTQAAQDRAAMVSGMAGAIGSGAQAYQSGQAADRDYEQREREMKYRYGQMNRSGV